MVIVYVIEQTLKALEVLTQRMFSHREKQRIKVEDKCKSLFFLSDEYLAINKGEDVSEIHGIIKMERATDVVAW